MGRVFLCLSPVGRKLAVKVIREDRAADPVFHERFRREVDAARKVDGLHTAGVVDAQLDGEVLWLATAYGGPSLERVVREYGPLPAGSLLALAAGLAEGLAATHAPGLVRWGPCSPSPPRAPRRSAKMRRRTWHAGSGGTSRGWMGFPT